MRQQRQRQQKSISGINTHTACFTYYSHFWYCIFFSSSPIYSISYGKKSPGTTQKMKFFVFFVAFFVTFFCLFAPIFYLLLFIFIEMNEMHNLPNGIFSVIVWPRTWFIPNNKMIVQPIIITFCILFDFIVSICLPFVSIPIVLCKFRVAKLVFFFSFLDVVHFSHRTNFVLKLNFICSISNQVYLNFYLLLLAIEQSMHQWAKNQFNFDFWRM